MDANVASAPGLDGIPAAFYIDFFPAICKPLLDMVNGLMAGGAKPGSF